MKIEIKISVDLVSQKNKLIKKDIHLRQMIDTEDIYSQQEIFNQRGNLVKNKCKIFVKDLGPLIVSHSYNEIKELVKPLVIKGFIK